MLVTTDDSLIGEADEMVAFASLRASSVKLAARDVVLSLAGKSPA